MVRQRGFTLTEILVVIFIVGLVATFAFPAMSTFLTTQAVRSSSYDLFADLIYARSEAIARGTTVTVTGVDGTNWKKGWTIRENEGGTVLRTQSSRDSAITFTASGAEVTFDRTGRASNAAEMTFTIVPVKSTSQDYQKRCIRLDPSGRPKSSEGTCA